MDQHLRAETTLGAAAADLPPRYQRIRPSERRRASGKYQEASGSLIHITSTVPGSGHLPEKQKSLKNSGGYNDQACSGMYSLQPKQE